MKKAIAILLVIVLLLTTLVLWWLQQQKELPVIGIFISIAVIIIIVFLFFESVKKIKDSKKNLPIDDELSKRADYRAGYVSYLISVYIWIALFFFKDFFLQINYIFLIGIFSMALVFIVTRFIYRKRGEV